MFEDKLVDALRETPLRCNKDMTQAMCRGKYDACASALCFPCYQTNAKTWIVDPVYLKSGITTLRGLFPDDNTCAQALLLQWNNVHAVLQPWFEEHTRAMAKAAYAATTQVDYDDMLKHKMNREALRRYGDRPLTPDESKRVEGVVLRSILNADTAAAP